MSVRKAVWLVMKRNGANKDLRLLFSKRCAHCHFEHESHWLRHARRKMQRACKHNPLVAVWRVCSEMTSRVCKFVGCDCHECTSAQSNNLRYDKRLRMWLRFQMPYLSRTDSQAKL